MDASFNKKQQIHAFNRSASTLHEVRMLHHEIGNRLLERLSFIKIHPKRILDIGAGLGEFTNALSKRYLEAQTIGLDIAKQRLFRAQKNDSNPYICADVESLPIKDHSIDLVFSNLTLNFCSNLLTAFKHIRRILSEDGVFLFSMLGRDTLQEIRESWQAVDNEIHIYDFEDMHHVGDALLQAGFQDPVMDMEHITLEYNNLQTLLSDIKKAGATHFSSNKMKGLLSRERYLKFLQTVTQKHLKEGKLPITFEIVYGYAISKFKIKSC